ncbi:MAG: DUF11 domain-containing protein, partial [Xanthomonadales bacterium]|nr:DUF11 domain-containing protein [Xanthomonadales bacterium]
MAPSGAVVPLAACDVGEPGLIVHDDGQLENGYGYNSLAANGYIVDRFTPADYPATVSTVCIMLITNAGLTTAPIEIQVYADDGTGGAPGSLLGTKAVTGHPVGIAGLPANAQFEAFDLSDLGISINSGSAYIGVKTAGTDGLFLAADQSPATPSAGGQTHADTDPWGPITAVWPDYRAMMIRAAMPAAGPGAPSLTKAFAPAQVLAGEVSTLTITLRNTTQPTAAVLSAALVDNLPAGVVIADTPDASTTCGGSVSATAGGSSVSLAAGASIPAGGTCTISVDVTAAADGNYQNVIPAGALQTNHGNNASDATADLRIGFVFPEPYCAVTFPSGIEPITRVVFSNIDNPSPTTGGPPLEDFTNIVGNVGPGQTVQMAVEGNTAGNFTTKVNAYIDWNQNGVFDSNEGYFIGDIINSTGADGQQAVAEIDVPTDALPGTTRMRVIKKFNAEAPACNSAGYGQAEDYTLTVGPTSTAPTVSKAFAPAQVLVDEPSTLTITLTNSENATDAELLGALVDTFPSGLVVADVPNASTTCADGTVTAAAGAGSVSLAAGALIPGSGSCVVTVDVQSSADGSYVNTIAAGALDTNEGENPFPASATLKVGFTFPEPYCNVTFPSGIEPITRVVFDGIDNASALTGGPPLEDFTAVVGNVQAGTSVQIAVEGNTAGNFTTVVNAFIDWNHNGVFDTDEGYPIGNIVNSTGADGQQAVNTIAVPASAVNGPTRMRVLKRYNVAATPCNAEGFGQAEDYTLLVGPAMPSVSKAFSPVQVEEAEDSTLTITVSNPTAADATLTAPLVDNLPAGMTVSAASTSCGLIIGTTGPAIAASTITLPAGVVLPAGSTCDITATVQAADAGTYENVIPAGGLQTDQGDSPMAASATLTVVEPAVGGGIEVTPGSLSATQGAGQTTTQTLTIANVGAGDLIWNITEAAARGPYTPSGVAERQSPRVTAPRAPFVRDWAAAPLAEAIQDGGFEQGDPNPFWDTDSLNFGTVLCDSSCSNSPENAPHSGSWWAWFGGIDSFETGMVSQQVTIPSGGATLKFWVRVPFSSGLAADFLKASVDGTEVWRVTADAAGAYQAAYQQVTVDVSAFADGGTHTIRFDSTVVGGGAETSNFMLDDVSLETGTGGGGCTAQDIPWLSVGPASGTTAPGSSTPVTVTFDSTGLAAGSYDGKLCVNSNDPANPTVEVPVSLTVSDGTGDPIAEVTPASLDFTVDEGDMGSDVMVIANIGGGTLTYAITEAEFDRNPPSYKTAAARLASKAGALKAGAFEAGTLSSARSLGVNAFGRPFVLQATDISQMDDNSPGDEGVACNLNDGTGVSDNSWWRRFYFNEHANVGASANVVSVTISTGSTTLPGGVPSTINLYTIPHSVTVNTIPTGQLTLIGTANFTATGSLQAITVPVTGAITDTVGKDLVVEWHTDGATGGPFYPGANASAETHPTFLSSSGCGLNQPETATAIGFPDFHLTMVVTLDDGGSEPEACD